MVRERGLEPPRPKALEPKSSASANSATRAQPGRNYPKSATKCKPAISNSEILITGNNRASDSLLQASFSPWFIPILSESLLSITENTEPRSNTLPQSFLTPIPMFSQFPRLSKASSPLRWPQQ